MLHTMDILRITKVILKDYWKKKLTPLTVKNWIFNKKKSLYFLIVKGLINPNTVSRAQCTDWQAEWLLRAPVQGFRIFSFNLLSRVGPTFHFNPGSVLCFLFKCALVFSYIGLSNPIDMMYHIQPWMILALFPLSASMEGKKSVFQAAHFWSGR